MRDKNFFARVGRCFPFFLSCTALVVVSLLTGSVSLARVVFDSLFHAHAVQTFRHVSDFFFFLGFAPLPWTTSLTRALAQPRHRRREHRVDRPGGGRGGRHAAPFQMPPPSMSWASAQTHSMPCGNFFFLIFFFLHEISTWRHGFLIPAPRGAALQDAVVAAIKSGAVKGVAPGVARWRG